MWVHRNGIAHDPDHPIKEEEKRITAEQIQTEYRSDPNQLEPRDRPLLNVPIDTLLHQYGLDQQKNWLHSVQASRNRYALKLNQDEGPNQTVTNMRIGLSHWLGGRNSGD